MKYHGVNAIGPSNKWPEINGFHWVGQNPTYIGDITSFITGKGSPCFELVPGILFFSDLPSV